MQGLISPVKHSSKEYLNFSLALFLILWVTSKDFFPCFTLLLTPYHYSLTLFLTLCIPSLSTIFSMLFLSCSVCFLYGALSYDFFHPLPRKEDKVCFKDYAQSYLKKRRGGEEEGKFADSGIQKMPKEGQR